MKLLFILSALILSTSTTVSAGIVETQASATHCGDPQADNEFTKVDYNGNPPKPQSTSQALTAK